MTKANLSTYFNYSLNERINRKFHLGHGCLMERLVDCMRKPEMYMQAHHYDNLRGRVCMTGESVIRRTGVIPYQLRGYGKMINGRPQEFPINNL